MGIRKNAVILISQCVFAVLLAICAFAGITDNASKLKAEALSTANEILKAQNEQAQAAANEKTEKHPDKKKHKHHASGKAEKNLKDGVYFGTGRGYGGDIKVKLTVENGKIKSLDVIDSSSETPSFFNRAISVASDIVKAGTADVDGVSGATLSSNGIKAAASDAIKQAGGKGKTTIKAASRTKTPAKGKTKKKAYKKPKSGWKDGKYTGSARGFGGTVSVTVTIKGGKIKSISASGSSETASYWSRAQAVKGRIIKAQNPKVDAVSGATYSSNGIINAVIAALSKAERSDGPKTQTISTAKDEYRVTAGKTVRIRAKAKTKLKYRSSDNSVAAVNKKGKVTAKAAGTVKITISARKSSKYKKAKKTVKVTVTRKGQTITIPGMKAGSAVIFKESDKGTELPLKAYSSSGKALKYSTDNKAAAMVSKQGVVLINGKGTARITIKAPRTKVYESATAVLIIRVMSDTGDDPVLVSGTFTGTGKGYGGDVICTVVIEESIIKKITPEGPEESPAYWFEAKRIVPKMISQQTWNVDAISGATLSSNGIRNAVKQALENAGLI